MKKAWWIVALLILGGCGDDSDGPRQPTATVTAAATATLAPPTRTEPPAATASSTPVATASTTHSATPSVTPTATEAPDGFVARATFQQRQLDYLRFATAQLAPQSIMNVIAHMERSRVDPGFAITPGAVPADAWDAHFAKLAALEDTRDFEGIELVNVLYGYADHPLLADGLYAKVEQAMLGFKFWYDEPTPDGLIDDSYYWTENHQVLYHAIEYLVGQRYPDQVMASDGKTGAEHREHARELLLRWFDFRARFGFTEWHSNVYYQEDLNALLTLAEFADDPAIQVRAAGVLDTLLFDLSLHTLRGNFGATHGRSYKKDKMSGVDDDTWGAVKLLFEQSERAYTSMSDSGAGLLARAARYRVPEAIWRLGRSDATFSDREHMSLPLDEDGPWEANPQAPFGYSYTDPRDLVVWWGMQALTAWPVVPLSVATINQYNLWETQLFQRFLGLRPLTEDIVAAGQLAAALHQMLGFALLKEVNTYTYRTADYLLSTAQDYRKGTLNGQAHAWQATFDTDAIVFTQHPAVPVVQSTNWRTDPDPGYWTGEATMPRSAQHLNVGLHLYAPRYLADLPPPLDAFRYEPYTHAYFPQDHFDEVIQDGNWVFGRRGDGFVALYSYRPPLWLAYDPGVVATNGMTRPFDLRALGGADNVWIVECGSAADGTSFADFRSAITAAPVDVTVLPPLTGGLPGGFDVVYQSPSRGRITFGWDAPLTVDGSEIAIADYPRRDNPWSYTEYGSRTTSIEVDGYRIDLDFEQGTRRITPP